MQKLTIEKLYKNDKNKDGKEYIDRDGKKYSLIKAKFVDVDGFYYARSYGNDKYISLEQGDDVSVNLIGGDFPTFKLADANVLILQRLDELERIVKHLVNAHNKTALDIVDDDVDLDPSKIPF